MVYEYFYLLAFVSNLWSPSSAFVWFGLTGLIHQQLMTSFMVLTGSQNQSYCPT